ncbi:biogenesis of lysosome-related organelles complex 1 subunit 5-like [Daktulosphaira vitifoliae]|uniref:biogenesis of lysosome-related organelles complex 1 subunit 5-like n=1 Tax=Daktulosphaira vitifoliae TaxID=58002 RepID=UPI0021A9B974|nr:biogenesis of lysosome-related organelles complex 1 subunit 5-like [Daktulosphaira vitifoliae]
MTDVFKDLCDIWDRLFSHRPFLQGEIKYFLSEFDKKQYKFDEENLKNVNELIGDIKEDKINDFLLTSDQNLSSLSKVINKALDLSADILNQENKIITEEELNDKQERQRKRQEEFDLFKSDLKIRYETIDKNIEEKIKSIKLQYEETINKLISDNQ